MDIQNFIHKLTEIFEDANPEAIKPESKLREIDGYSSLVAFLIIGMVDEVYNVNLTGEDLRNSNSIEDIFFTIKSRR